jgi:hypothetical protein
MSSSRLQPGNPVPEMGARDAFELALAQENLNEFQARQDIHCFVCGKLPAPQPCLWTPGPETKAELGLDDGREYFTPYKLCLECARRVCSGDQQLVDSITETIADWYRRGREGL